MNETPAASKSRLPDWPFVLYLLTGLGGLIFMAGEELSRLGWLEKAVNSIFGSYAKGVLENLNGLEILLVYLLVPMIPIMVILAIFIVVRYWRSWQLAGPAVLFLSTVSMFIGIEVKAGYQENAYATLITILFGLYFLSASFIGLRWLIKIRRDGSNRPVFKNSGLYQLAGRIDNIETADLAIKGSATAIYILVIINFHSLTEITIGVLLGWILYKFKSKFAAVLLLVLSLVYFAVHIAVFLFIDGSVLLGLLFGIPALLLIWVAWRSIQGTYKYHSFLEEAEGG